MPAPRSLPHPHGDRDLESFAAVLAEHLPGTWTTAFHPHAHAQDQLRHAEDVWDLDLVADAIATHPLGQDAHLSGDDGTRLYVTVRPGHDEEFLVAALAPTHLFTPKAFTGVREPDGIAVPADPERAARAITADLLPRYTIALAQVRHHALNPPQPAPDLAVEQVVMVWRDDGSLAATATTRPAAEVLIAEGFVWEAAANAYVLSGDDTRAQAHTVQTAGARLAHLGIPTLLRTAARPAIDAPPPAAPPAPHSTARTR
ncbi:hypothetical protein ACFH04_13635 [Streptomyces noboritoensis]|uniref:Uncharacterized protein n=1 Tax=Streptomyces noboritoensis TaxID=67337 RepID=A0ABV6THP8_9ACTN